MINLKEIEKTLRTPEVGYFFCDSLAMKGFYYWAVNLPACCDHCLVSLWTWSQLENIMLYVNVSDFIGFWIGIFVRCLEASRRAELEYSLVFHYGNA